MKKVIFLYHRTGKKLEDMPDQWPQEDLVVGHRIQKHIFRIGWRCLKITKVDDGQEPIRIFVKKSLW